MRIRDWFKTLGVIVFIIFAIVAVWLISVNTIGGLAIIGMVAVFVIPALLAIRTVLKWCDEDRKFNKR